LDDWCDSNYRSAGQNFISPAAIPEIVAIHSSRRQTIEYACFAPGIVPTACWKASSETAVTSTL
jgi:hypothetical protein